MLKMFLNLMIAIACTLGFVLIVVTWFLITTPRPTNVKTCFTTEMYHVNLCPGQPSYVPLRSISPNMRNAVIASEDTMFWQHKGIDFYELQKSFEKNMKEGKFARGGSTITQQLAKNLYLSSEKSLLRKLREAIIALQLEKTLTKEEILEKYLNVVEFGENIYGVKQAARVYFNKSPSDLTAVDSAFLAFLLPNPKKYSVSFKKKQLTPFARREIKKILGKLHSFRKLDDASYSASIAQVENMWGVAPAMEGEDETSESAVYDTTPLAEDELPPQDQVTEQVTKELIQEEDTSSAPPPPPTPLDDEIQNELDNATNPRYDQSEQQ